MLPLLNPFLPTPPVVGDVDGDGQEEIIIGTYNPSTTPSSGNLVMKFLQVTGVRSKFSLAVISMSAMDIKTRNVWPSC